ncbi:MAG: hypothetical protein LAT67_03850 [Balneolales bacterium]|nr:hypothetical protein [Balneolales bacterium]
MAVNINHILGSIWLIVAYGSMLSTEPAMASAPEYGNSNRAQSLQSGERLQQLRKAWHENETAKHTDIPSRISRTDTTETSPDTLQTTPSDTTRPSAIDRQADRFGSTVRSERDRAPQPIVTPMQPVSSVGYQVAFTDSLLRWEQWYNLAERHQAQRGVISYRLGSYGRNDASLIRAIEPRHQLYTFEGIPLNDPVSGTLNTNWLPLDRFGMYAQETAGIRYQSEFSLRRFYVNKPLTWINYEDTRRNVRRAEAILTQNISRQGNVELAYRGMNDDGDYRRSGLDGRQASVRYSHYLNENWTGQAMLLYNNMQLQESGGYEILNPAIFDFEPLSVLAREASASSSYRSSLLTFSAYHRPDSLSPQQSRIHLYHARNRRFYRSPQDSTFHRTFGYGLYADTRLDNSWAEVQPFIHGRINILDDEQNTVLTRASWTEAQGGIRLRFEPADLVELRGWGQFNYRTDPRSSYELGYRIRFSLSDRISLFQSLAVGEVMPTIQQMHWLGSGYRGSADLVNEQMFRVEGGIDFNTGILSSAGLHVYGSRIGNPVVIEPQTGNFKNIDSYLSAGAELFADFETEFIETGISATVQLYESSSQRDENLFLDNSGIRNTNRAYLFYKNYFFDFATYARVGMVVTFSPNAYFSSSYHPILDYWDPLSDEFSIPSYFRTDLEASARVRQLIVLLRYENILDGVGQAGYFETAPYPMPPRRFRFGIRVVLRN